LPENALAWLAPYRNRSDCRDSLPKSGCIFLLFHFLRRHFVTATSQSSYHRAAFEHSRSCRREKNAKAKGHG
jgi:hypothetical protein